MKPLKRNQDASTLFESDPQAALLVYDKTSSLTPYERCLPMPWDASAVPESPRTARTPLGAPSERASGDQADAAADRIIPEREF